MKQREIVKKLK